MKIDGPMDSTDVDVKLREHVRVEICNEGKSGIEKSEEKLKRVFFSMQKQKIMTSINSQLSRSPLHRFQRYLFNDISNILV